MHGKRAHLDEFPRIKAQSLSYILTLKGEQKPQAHTCMCNQAQIQYRQTCLCICTYVRMYIHSRLPIEVLICPNSGTRRNKVPCLAKLSFPSRALATTGTYR